MKYIVIEVQNGTALTNDYADIASAWAKYYTVLAAAAASDVTRHGAYLVDNLGNLIAQRFFVRDEPEA